MWWSILTGYDQSSLDLRSDSFLRKNIIFSLFNKTFKVIFNDEKYPIQHKLFTLQPYRSIVKIMEKQLIFNFTLQNIYSNIEMIYIICTVIPTKMDTSQVPQQNVNWMPTVKAMITQPESEGSSVPPLLVSKYYLPMWMWSILTGYDQNFFRHKVWEFPMQTWNYLL